MPLFFTKKEVFQWLKEGKKTIDVRKGKPFRGEFAVFQAGPHTLRLRIVRRETGKLAEIVRPDNFRLVVPSALVVDEAIGYLQGLYVAYEGVFTAYHIAQSKG